jgi:hypothetical protein
LHQIGNESTKESEAGRQNTVSHYSRR